jgi:hypothetical protein
MKDWIIYCDATRLLWDAQEDDNAGAVSSNWQPVTKSQAMRFIAEMEHREGWTRGHWNAPRF